MENSLQPGLTYEFKFKVPENKTVPHLYPESPEFQAMPNVLATGFMVGLFEWTCIQAINPHTVLGVSLSVPDTLHIFGSYPNLSLLYQHSILGPKNCCPSMSCSLTF